MSPARARTSDGDVIGAARALLERGGPEAVTMQAVAVDVGVRAPSLYKRFPSRSALLSAIADQTARDLGGAVAPGFSRDAPVDALVEVMSRYRTFAREHPQAYRLLFSPQQASQGPSVSANIDATAGILRFTEGLVGPRKALSAARLLVAYVHGFLSMEQAGAFRLGGDLDEAFEDGLSWVLDGLRVGQTRRATRAR